MLISLVIALLALAIAGVISFTILTFNAQNIKALRQKRLDEMDVQHLKDASTLEQRKLAEAHKDELLAERDLMMLRHQLRLNPPEA